MALPEEIGDVEVTCLCYSTNFILYTGTNSGRVCVWDCNSHRCFMTWEADDGEIGEEVKKNILVCFHLISICLYRNFNTSINLVCFCVCSVCRCAAVSW